MTEMKFLFMMFATEVNNEAINWFEESSTKVAFINSKLTELLRYQLKQFMVDPVIEDMDEEGNIVIKEGKSLLGVDIEGGRHRSNKQLKIGEECEKKIRSLGLSPTSPQLKWFFDQVRIYHKTKAKFYIKYFSSALESNVLKACSSLDPAAQSKITTKHKLLVLGKTYSKTVDRIGNMDIFRREVEEFIEDDFLKQNQDLPFDHFWQLVKERKEEDWIKYEILPRFANAMGTIMNSNSDCERDVLIPYEDWERSSKKCHVPRNV